MLLPRQTTYKTQSMPSDLSSRGMHLSSSIPFADCRDGRRSAIIDGYVLRIVVAFNKMRDGNGRGVGVCGWSVLAFGPTIT